MLAILTLGGLLGIITLKNKTEETINNLYIELDNEREKVDILTQENNVLESILNNYTIEERKEGNSYEQ